MKKDNWEKEFEQEFVDPDRESLIYHYIETREIKSFIKELLKSQQAEFKKKIEDIECCDKHEPSCSIKSLIADMCCQNCHSYTVVLSDILEKLKL